LCFAFLFLLPGIVMLFSVDPKTVHLFKGKKERKRTRVAWRSSLNPKS
jgi:hypothetical protein